MHLAQVLHALPKAVATGLHKRGGYFNRGAGWRVGTAQVGHIAALQGLRVAPLQARAGL